MKYHPILFLFLTLVSWISTAETIQTPKSPYSVIPNEKEFYLSLMQHKDINIQAFGLRVLASQFDAQEIKPVLRRKMLNSFKRLIDDPKIPAKTFHDLYYMCEYQVLIFECSIDQIVTKHIESYPLDGTAYLIPLEEAQKSDNDSEVIYWFKKIVNAHLPPRNVYGQPEVFDLLDKHLKEFPYSIELVESAVDEYVDSAFRREAPTEEELQNIEEQMPEFLKSIAVFQISMETVLPEIWRLIKLCENYSELKNDCITLGEKVYELQDYQNQSFSMLILERTYRASSNEKLADEVKIKKERFDKLHGCLYGGNFNFSILDGSYQRVKESIVVGAEKGEWAGYKRFAELNYHAALQSEKSWAESLNPELCFQGINKDYFESIFDELM